MKTTEVIYFIGKDQPFNVRRVEVTIILVPDQRNVKVDKLVGNLYTYIKIITIVKDVDKPMVN